MPTCSRQTLVKDHAFLVKPAYYLKSLYVVRGFCVLIHFAGTEMNLKTKVLILLVARNPNSWVFNLYNLRGGKERIFDDMNNDFGLNRLPKSFMAQNTVFLLMTALIRNFYKAIMQRLKTHEFGLRATSRIKTFVFKFISVPAKWIKTSRRHVLNIYSDNNAYANLFKTDFG